MKKLVFILFYITSISLCQNNDEVDSNPCSDPLISFARKFGVKGISIKDLPRYYKVSKACKEKGGEAIIDQIQVNEYNRDFQNSKFMSGWTSTYGMCVSVIVFFYFVGLLTVKK